MCLGFSYGCFGQAAGSTEAPVPTVAASLAATTTSPASRAQPPTRSTDAAAAAVAAAAQPASLAPLPQGANR
jgi:hypothetical protein